MIRGKSVPRNDNRWQYSPTTEKKRKNRRAVIAATWLKTKRTAYPRYHCRREGNARNNKSVLNSHAKFSGYFFVFRIQARNGLLSRSTLRNAPNRILRDSRARLSNNFELKSRTARPAFPLLCAAHSDAFAARRTRPASRYAHSNAKFISRFRSGSRWESRKVTRGIFDTGWACRASPIDLTNRLFFSLAYYIILFFLLLLIYYLLCFNLFYYDGKISDDIIHLKIVLTDFTIYCISIVSCINVVSIIV